MRRMRRSIVRFSTVILLAACATSLPDPGIMVVGPEMEVNDLVAADRAFAAAAAERDGIHALTAMFAPNVIMPVPGGRFAEGAVQAAEALRLNPDNARSRLDWVPIRGGISADGQHGFTYGYMTMHRLDGAPVQMKYLSYWISRPEGWRVAVYKRQPRGSGDVSLAVMPPAVPPLLIPISANTAQINQFQASLRDAERAFSDSAQTMGLGAAFELFASENAMYMGGPESPGFVIGPEAIGRAVSQGDMRGASPVSWAADRVIVASSGDLGVTIGTIRSNTPPAAGPAEGIPYFTIWRRDSPADPWRYVAE